MGLYFAFYLTYLFSFPAIPLFFEPIFPNILLQYHVFASHIQNSLNNKQTNCPSCLIHCQFVVGYVLIKFWLWVANLFKRGGNYFYGKLCDILALIKTHDSGSCSQVQPEGARDRQVCIIQEPSKCRFPASATR